MSISLATEPDRPVWDAYVEAHPDGLAYHRFAWKTAVERAYGFEGLYLIAKRGSTVCGVLPMVHHKLPFTAGKLISLPYCDVGGVLADDEDVAEALIAEALRWTRRRGAKALELRKAASHRVPLTAGDPLGPTTPDSRSTPHDLRFTTDDSRFTTDDSRFTTDDSRLSPPDPRAAVSHLPVTPHPSPLVAPKVRMLLSLPNSSEALMQGFKSKHRSQVRKPIRDGLKARLGGAEEVGTFYAVFAENMRDLGSPVHSRRWIHEVVQAFGGLVRIGIVCLPDGTPAAAGVILMNGTTVSIPWASSLRRCNRQNPNMLLYWTFLSWAADHGFDTFDFGRSTPGEGTYRFKAQWGAKPTELDWTTFAADGTKRVESRGAGDGRFRARAESLWRQLPQGVCDVLGPRVRKHVSL